MLFFSEKYRGFQGGVFPECFFRFTLFSRLNTRYLDGLGKGSTMYSSAFFEVFRITKNEKARFLEENGFLLREGFPSFFRFFDADILKRGRFLGVFAQRANFSRRHLEVFSGVFLKLKNALHGETSFSRRKQGFLSRLFADGLFRMIISSQGISWPATEGDDALREELDLLAVGWASPTIGSHKPGREPRNTLKTRKKLQANAIQVKTKGWLRPPKSLMHDR